MSLITGTPTQPKDFFFEIGENSMAGKTFVHKFGRNPDIDTASGFEAIWNGGGDYSGFNATSGEQLEVLSSSANDVGTLLSSGTATGGSDTTLIDSGATFVTDTVAVGHIILNDTNQSHGAVIEVTSETTLTVARFDKESLFSASVSVGDSYRVAKAGSTGLAVVELFYLLDSDFDNETGEFIILNGTNGVDTIGTDYIRCSRVQGIIAGSNKSNIGTITVRQKVTTANVYGVMPIGYNETMIACYTIPKLFEGHMSFWKPSLSAKKTAFSIVRLIVRHRGEVFRIVEETAVTATGSSAEPRPYQIPKNQLSGGTDIKVMADTDTNDTAVSAQFDLILTKI